MAALDFDNSPNTESSVSTGDITWKLSKNASDGTPIWYATTDATQVIHVGVSAPTNPRPGQMWWCSAIADEGGGRLYVYYDDVWVDTSLPGGGQGGDFLSKTEDDTAAGKITFQGQTTHEAGVSVTGGTPASLAITANENQNIIIGNANSLVQRDNPDAVTIHRQNATVADRTNDVVISQVGVSLDSANREEVAGIEVQVNNDIRATELNLFKTNVVVPQTGRTINITRGYYSDINETDSQNAFNFYAAGSAPNYFRGVVTVGSSALRDSTLPFNKQNIVLASNSSADAGGSIGIMAAKPDVTRTLISFFKNSTDGDFSTAQFAGKIYCTGGTAPAIRFKSADGAAIGAFSDPREISNVQPIAFNASNVIKLLEPKSFELGGRNQLGFVTTNIAANLAIAAEGSETATTALGTLVTASGETTENIEEPESLPYGDTWTQTTVVNEAQSYDPLQLIPVLTKALQEALNRIEALESNEVVDDATDSALLTLVANLATRVTALEGA